MKSLEEILDRQGRSIETIITDLKQKSTSPPAWAELKKILDPNSHKIVDDDIGRPSKVVQTANGTRLEEAAKNTLGLEMLLVERLNEFMFTLPVVREYDGIGDSEVRQEIAKAIEKIYEEVDIDTVNIERGEAFFACCEVYTLWYTVMQQNTRYGFDSPAKLRCRVFSPKDDEVELYPLLDEYGDMLAMSIYFTNHKTEKEKVEFFETWTKDKHFKWVNDGNGWVDELYYLDAQGNTVYGQPIEILKIPGVYAWRKTAAYKPGTPELREDTEYMHSRDSDTIAYNNAPVLKIAGEVRGSEEKGETRRIYRVENGGDVSYVSWNQATEATDKHIQRNIDWFWMINQMPDISFKNLQSLGNIGYDARQMMLTDAYLRVGKESKPLLQMLRRESNVIKAFLKSMAQKDWSAEDIDAVVVKHKIQMYIPKDEKYEIEKRTMANGGKPIESQRESIQRYGKSVDAQATLEEIQEENKNEQQASIANVLEGAI